MNLNSLIKVTTRSKKRVGRGIGSGMGKTAGRGQKGQKARGSVPLSQSGTGLHLYKKLPFRRGIGNAKVSGKLVAVQLSSLSILKAGSEVTLESLLENKLISPRNVKKGIKIVGKAKILVKLIIKTPITKSAAEIIQKAGGSVL